MLERLQSHGDNTIVTMSVLVWMSSKLTTSGDTNSGVPTMALTNQRRLLWSRDRGSTNHSSPSTHHWPPSPWPRLRCPSPWFRTDTDLGRYFVSVRNRNYLLRLHVCFSFASFILPLDSKHKRRQYLSFLLLTNSFIKSKLLGLLFA